MAKEKIEELSSEKITRRKKFGSIILIVLIVLAIADISLFLYDLIWEDNFTSSLLVSSGALVVMIIPIYIGNKKINEELARRSS